MTPVNDYDAWSTKVSVFRDRLEGAANYGDKAATLALISEFDELAEDAHRLIGGDDA